MDDADTVKYREYLEKLTANVRSAWHKTGEQLDALESALAGEDTPNTIAKRLMHSFGRLWTDTYKTKYVAAGNFVATMQGVKRLLKALPEAEVERRMQRYLASNDGFYVNAKHPIEMFIKAINKFAPASGPALDFRPIGCHHLPHCDDEVHHTRRIRDEARQRQNSDKYGGPKL